MAGRRVEVCGLSNQLCCYAAESAWKHLGGRAVRHGLRSWERDHAPPHQSWWWTSRASPGVCAHDLTGPCTALERRRLQRVPCAV